MTFTYQPAGQRLSVTDVRGTTGYAYDARNRLTEVTEPDGRRLGYTLDGAGRRTALVALVGAVTLTTGFSYDDANRLTTLTDPNAGAYTQHFDARADRDALTYPNGASNHYEFDSQHRLQHLWTEDALAAHLQEYTYSLAASGRRDAITELDGATRAYAYDALDRLTGETVTRNAAPVYSKTFTYDRAGNRLTQSHTDAQSVTPPTPSTYDPRDRLQTGAALWVTISPVRRSRAS